MRRGHPGMGGWRNEKTRHFRPRNGGNQHFRPSGGYGLLDQHRFPPPISRPHRPPLPYKHRSTSDDRTRHNHHDRRNYRSDYRSNNYSRSHEGSHQSHDKQTYSMARSARPSETSYNNSNTYPTESSTYYESLNNHCNMNSMGDIDDRYVTPRQPFRQNSISSWGNDNNIKKFDERPHRYECNKPNRYDSSENSKIPLYDYPGHRPPSSDHYGGNPTPVINNTGSFNRSVDDTVDIIRKRILNRNDPQSENNDSKFNFMPDDTKIKQRTKESIQNFHHEQPLKKKVNRQKQSNKSSNDESFTKIKSKIVNQLFKMDKEKIHKLMDNPNSSSKFEYAISSLITESQYSFNRHLRSVAEKSLHNSSSIDFIQNDNNTIYEDTFMKQMQCILDPQDTVLLEDIKPIVMAELSKALQLDEYSQQPFETSHDEIHHEGQQTNEQPSYSNVYYDDLYNYENYKSFSDNRDQKIPISHLDHTEPESVPENTDIHNRVYEKNDKNDYEVMDTICETQQRRKNSSQEKDIITASPQYTRKSLDDRLSELFTITNNSHSTSESPLFGSKSDSQPLFETNIEPLEDEDDPFAELDKQYHVAVDHSFIDNDDSSSLNLEKDYAEPSSPSSNPNLSLNINTPEKESIKQEIDHQLQNMAKSPLKFPPYVDNIIKSQAGDVPKNLSIVKEELQKCSDHALKTAQVEMSTSSKANEDIELKEAKKGIVKSETSQVINKSSDQAKSRKRSIDQSPSHRKEKRKKSNSVSHDTDKAFLNKNMVVTIKDSSSKLSRKEHDKQSFPEKHAKRKSDHKDEDLRKKLNPTENFNTSISPKESHNTVICKQPIKSEAKTTLKTFDLFTEQPKKVSIHHAHRNTALAPATDVKTITKPNTIKPIKISKTNTQVEVVKNMHSIQIQTDEIIKTCPKFSQTDKKRTVAKATQTYIVPSISINKDPKRSADPLERMKEIDMEIQVLLQEKFKLYSSIESKEAAKNTMHSLGMTVVSVLPFGEEEEVKNDLPENIPSEDSIVDDFTSIPVEELEQIAFESIEIKQVEDPKPETRNRRLRAFDKEKSKSQSPTPASQKKSSKKGKTPNISLIEQIISDERPIEDIISLDDLEHTPVKGRVKNIKTKRKTKRRGPIGVKSTPCQDSDFILKDCSVLVVREDFSKYLPSMDAEKSDDSPVNAISVIVPSNDLSEESIINDNNDIHFDMLDVSEDIVIGDICEIKSIDDKEELGVADIPITEDIILDNSQSSIEEQQGSNADPKENECKMFDYASDENLRRDSVVVTGNADAVLAVECIENNFIAACLDGNVYYFNGDGQLLTTLKGSNLAVTCLTIVKEKYGTTVYTGSLDSRIRYYDLDTGLEKGPECNVLSPIQTMDRAWDTVFVGTRTGFVLQFECKNNMLIPISTVQFSEQSILALRAMKEGARKVLLVAARSEDVTIKDAQTGLLLRTLVGPKMTVYTLLYEDGKIYCGTSSSQIHVFDYSSGTHVGAHEGGKGAVCLRASGGLLFAGCYDGCVYVYREGERRPFAQLRGPSLMLLSLAVVGSKIIAGYKDRSLYIWKIPLSILQEMIL